MLHLVLLAATLQVTPPLTIEQQLPQGYGMVLSVEIQGKGKLKPEGEKWAPEILSVQGDKVEVVAGGLFVKAKKKPLRAGQTVEVGLTAEATRAMATGRRPWRLRLNTKGGPTDSEDFMLWIIPAEVRLPTSDAGRALKVGVEGLLFVGDTETATAIAEKAFESRDTARYDPAVLESLGRCYEATGYRDDAEAMYDHAAHATAGQDPKTAERMVEFIRRVKKARRKKGSKKMKHPDMKHEH